MASLSCVAEQTQFLIGLKRAQVDRLPWAVSKVTRDGIFTYGNKKLCAIFGVKTIESRNITDFFRGDALTKVSDHLQSRFTAYVADEYSVLLTRPDGVDVPVLISGIPELNEEGKPTAVIAFVRNLLALDVSQNMHGAIENFLDSHELLDRVAKETQRIVSFDMFGVTLYSEDGEHARSLYIYPEGEIQSTSRWYPMTEFAKKFVAANKVQNEPDLEEFFRRPEWAPYRNDPGVAQMLNMGLRSSLSIRIMSGGRVVATLGFSRKKENGAFRKDEEQQVLSLPLESVVRMVLHREQEREMEFSLTLMRQISACTNPEEIPRLLTAKIAEQYHFGNVSIFEVDESEGKLRLLEQHAETESAHLPEGYHQGIDEGVIGHVRKTRVALNIADVTDPKYKHIYKPTCAKTRAELCIPIPLGQRIRFLLNLEDPRKNAFAQEEQRALENIVRETALVLELRWKTQVFSELLQHSNDAIIQTDVPGIIRETNPATEEFLGYKAEEMAGMPLQKFFRNKEKAGQEVQQASVVRNTEYTLQHKDGSAVPMLISCTSLPQQFGMKLYICNDLSNRKRMETMEVLRHMYNEIATQIKTPLSLAFTWLDKLQKIETAAEATEILTKTIKQLKKVDLTYDRLLLYERHHAIAPQEKVVFEIRNLIREIQLDMPDSEAAHLIVTSHGQAAPVRADLHQIWFCFASMIGYLVRFVPASGKVSVDISSHDGRVLTVIRGFAPQVTGGAVADYAKVRWAIHAITEMALGENVIKKFVERNHNGAFREQLDADGLTEYTVELPGIAEGAR